MKRLSTAFALIGLSLAFGAVSLSFAKAQAEPQETQAGWRDMISDVSGYFEKVTDPSTIEDGEDLLMVGDHNSTFDMYYAANYHDYVSCGDRFQYYSEDLIYLNNHKCELFTFDKTGADFYIRLKTYYDYAKYDPDEPWPEENGYLCQDDGSGQVTPWGGLDIKSSKKDQNNYKWHLTYNGENMEIRSLTDRLLTWRSAVGTYGTDAFIAYSSSKHSNVNLYRPVKNMSGFDADIIPDTTVYSKQDTLRTNGLGVYFTTPNPVEGVDTHWVYIPDHPRFFDIDTDIDYPTAGVKTRSFTFKPTGQSYNFDITISDGSAQYYHFSLIDSAKEKDFRGTYLAIAENAGVAYDVGAEYYNQSDTGQKIALTGLNTGNHTLNTNDPDVFECVRWNNRTSSHNHAAFSLAVNRNSPDPEALFIRSYSNSFGIGYGQSNASNLEVLPQADQQAVQIVGNTLTINGLTLRYNPTISRFCLSSDTNLEAAKLYRLEVNSTTLGEVESFRSDFRQYCMSNCDADGSTNVATLGTSWNNRISDYYDICGPDAQRYFAAFEYSPSHYEVGSVDEMVAGYEYVLAKYGEQESKITDFMFRENAGTYHYSALQRSQLPTLSGTSTMPIIILAGLGSLTAIGAFVFLKRKEGKAGKHVGD